MDNSTNHQSTSGPSPPKPTVKRPHSNASTPPGKSPGSPKDSKKAKAADNEPHLTWPQRYAVLIEKHMWLNMSSQRVERENKKLATRVMAGEMELDMTKEWMADQLEELDLWRKGIFIHPEHQVKMVTVAHEDTATPISLGVPANEDVAGSSSQNPPNSIGVQDSIDSNILKDLEIPSNLANDLECDEEFLNSVGAGSCGGGSGGSVKTVDVGSVNAFKQANPAGGGTSGAKIGRMVSKVVASGGTGLSQKSPNFQYHPSWGARLKSITDPRQATPVAGANGLAQNLNWGMYIPNLHQQGALIRQNVAQNVSNVVKTPRAVTPTTPGHPAQAHRLQVPQINGNHFIGAYRQGSTNPVVVPQAPPPKNVVPPNAQQSRTVPAPGLPTPLLVQPHIPEFRNTSDGNFKVYGYYRQVIPGTAQASQAPPTGKTIPDIQLSVAISNKDAAAAAQIQRYQEKLVEDAEKFLKMTGNK